MLLDLDNEAGQDSLLFMIIMLIEIDRLISAAANHILQTVVTIIFLRQNYWFLNRTSHCVLLPSSFLLIYSSYRIES